MKARTSSYTEQDRRYWRRRANLKVRKARIVRATVRWTLIVLLNAGIIAALLFTGAKALRKAACSPEFSLADIRVSGTGRTDPGAVQASLQPLMGASLLEIDLEAATRTVKELPWVKEAVIKRKLPRTLRVDLSERTPAVLAVIDGLVRVVDDTGHAICTAGPGAAFDLPVLTGLDRLEEEKLHHALAHAVSILRRLGEIDPGWTGQISHIDMSRDDRIVVSTRYPGPRLLLDPNRAERNLYPFLALSDEIHRRIGEAEYVDLRWRDRISVMPGEGS